MSAHPPQRTQGSLALSGVREVELDLLRALLLAEDRQEARERAERIERRVSDTVARADFADHLTAHIVEAIRRAERDDPKSMARALSPAVVQSIRREIANSKDELVDALYPITGRLVRASVRSAIANLVSDLNQRLEALTSPNLLKARLKSLVTGKPVASFLMASEVETVRLIGALLVDRQTGALVHSWPDSADEDTQDGREALIAAMLSALSSFAAETYANGNAELRSIDLNGRTLALRHSARHTLVVEHDGTLPPSTDAHLDTAFEHLLTCLTDPIALARSTVLKPLTVPPTRRGGLFKPIGAAIAALIIGLISWSAWDRWWFGHAAAIASRYVEAAAPRHTPSLETDRGARTITVRGLVPDGFDTARLAATLAERGIVFIDLTQPVAGTSDVAVLNGSLAQLSARTMSLSDKFDTAASNLEKRVDGLNPRLSALGEQVTNLYGSLDTVAARSTAGVAGAMAELSGLGAKVTANTQSFEERLTREVERLDASRAAIEAALEERAAELTKQTERARAEIAQANANLEVTHRALSEARKTFAVELSAVEERGRARVDLLADRARDMIEAMSVRFVRLNVPSDPEEASQQLATMATLATLFNFGLQIEGYGDLIGPSEANDAVASGRADMVRQKLIALGVLPERLRAVSRGGVPDANGRVTRQARVTVDRGAN